MRKIGEFDQEKLALRFWGYLKQHSIDASLEEEEAKCWSVWVGDEDTIEFAVLFSEVLLFEVSSKITHRRSLDFKR